MGISGISVSGLTDFDGAHWRKGILHYLFGVWGNRDSVMYRPKINFGNVTLRLNLESGEYYAYGESCTGGNPPLVKSSRELQVMRQQNDVEVGLVRFVKDPNWLKLIIWFGNKDEDGRLDSGSCLVLWKDESRRGVLNASAIGIPTFQEWAGLVEAA